jgi:nucleoside-diphosphate-sugar epimerase
LYDEVNVQGAKNIVQVCKEKKIERILFTSSVAVYGFAPKGTDESGTINYFNDYGRTKWEAENVYREWLKEDPTRRSLTIIRPTVVFGEGNRGNVYSLMKQIASGCFVMIGNGNNIKSLAYVENVAAFIEYCLNNPPGEHLYNYVDKPDLTMNELVRLIKSHLSQKERFHVHVPYWMGYFVAILLDALSSFTKKKYPLSRIRIEKFCKDTQFNTSISRTTSFICPVSLEEGLHRTLCSEFGIANKNPRGSL